MGQETRVAVYTRVSTEDQAKEGFSLDAQMERLEAYCKARGWAVATRYVDDGHSGRDTRRPAYQRMMTELDGWDTVLRDVREVDDLPPLAMRYVRRIETLLGIDCGLISVGPARAETIMLKNPFR